MRVDGDRDRVREWECDRMSLSSFNYNLHLSIINGVACTTGRALADLGVRVYLIPFIYPFCAPYSRVALFAFASVVGQTTRGSNFQSDQITQNTPS